MNSAVSPLSVTSADFVRSFGRWQDRIAARPVVVTHHGRDRLVALSMEKYQALVAGPGADDATEHDLPASGVIDRIAQGFVAFDAMLRIDHANPVACAYLRKPRFDIIGHRPGEDCPDFCGSLAEAKLVHAVEAGEVAAFDAPSRAYPGQWLHFEIFPHGAGAACLFRNITEEIATRGRADARDALIAAMEAHGAVGTALLSVRGTFRSVDKALAAMAGFSPDSLAQVRLADVLPLHLRVTAMEQLEVVFSGAGPQAFDSALLVNRGGERPVRLAIAAVHGDPAGEGATLVVTPR